MHVFLVRHGESEGNAAGIHQDEATPLSDIGLSQAAIVAHRFTKIPIEALIASDLKRAQQTAQAISKVVDLPVISSALLREIRRPTELYGMQYDDPLSIKTRNQMKEHIGEKEWHYSDEENYFDAHERALACLAMLSERDEERIVAVSHGLFISMLVSTVIFGDLFTPHLYERIYRTVRNDNTSITTLKHEDDQWRLITWNDREHLGAL